MSDFDKMAATFTEACRRGVSWKNYFGAAYSSRIKLAIADLKGAIEEAERHPAIGFVESSQRK